MPLFVRRTLLVSALLLGLTLGERGAAQDRRQDGAPAEAPPPEEREQAGEAPSAREAAAPAAREATPSRDPFRVAGAHSGASAAPVRLPPLAVRGTLRLAGKEPAALLAVGEQVQVVRVGQPFDVVVPPPPGARDAAPRRQTLVVSAIDRVSVTLTVGADGPPLVLR